MPFAIDPTTHLATDQRRKRLASSPTAKAILPAVEAGRQQIRDGRTIFEAQMVSLGAIALDGYGTDDLLTHVSAR